MSSVKENKNDHIEDIQHHVKVYINVFIALAILTVVTVAVSFLDVSFIEAFFIAITVATIKGSLVLSYFMHLLEEKPAVIWILVTTMPKVVKEKKATFSKSEPDPFYIKCDVHPWMKTWVLVSDHPYFAVTDAEGNFSIEGIPSGTYEVVCWQEKFGKRTLTAEVTIGEGDTTKDFVFTRPKKK